MIQFLGNIDAKIDAKARVFVPAAFRKLLLASGQTTLILRKDIFQDCLVLYPETVWEKEVAILRAKLSRWDNAQQKVFRQFVLGAERLDIDASGRILVPRKYLDMVGVESDVTFVGVDNTIELWAKDLIDKTLLSAEDFGEQLQQLMSDE